MKLTPLILFAIIFCVFPTFGQQDVQSFLDTAKNFEYDKKYDKAIVEINRAIEIEPNNSALYLKRANLYIHLKNNQAVLEDVRTAISFKPEDVRVLADGAEQLYLSRQYEESINIADLLISLGDESQYLGYRFRYLNKFQLKDYVGTMEDIIKSHGALSAFQEKVKLNNLDKLDYSESLLINTLNNLKNDPNIYSYYDELFKYFEDMREGPSTMAGQLILRSYWLNLYANYAKLYEEKRTLAEVADLFNKIEREGGLQNRAEIYEMLGRYNLAIKDISKLIESSDEKSYKLLQRGDLYALNNQFKAALADYEMAKKLDKEVKDRANEKIALAKKKMVEKSNQPH